MAVEVNSNQLVVIKQTIIERAKQSGTSQEDSNGQADSIISLATDIELPIQTRNLFAALLNNIGNEDRAVA